MKIVFFAPHSEPWAHAFPEGIIAEALQQEGHSIRYVTCGRLLNEFCVPMASHGLTPSAPADAKEKICAICSGNADLLRSRLNLKGEVLADFVTPAERREIDGSLEGLDREAILNLSHDGIPVGKLSLFNAIIRTKRADYNFDEAEWAGYVSDVRMSLFALRAAQIMFERDRPDRVIVYNSLYAVHGVVRALAEKLGIPCYFMHAGQNLANRLQTMMIGQGEPYSFGHHLIDRWPRHAAEPCGRDSLALVTGHILELLRGKSHFVYSAPKDQDYFDIRTFFGVASDQKIVVAILSSYDEAFASQSVGAMKVSTDAAFASQAEWVQALLAFAARRPDVFLIIRVHPREFPNRRDRRQSQHANQLASTLEHVPPNCRVNWPTDAVSVYDLAGEADIFLSAWSTVGKEISWLGVPALGYARGMTLYPDDLHEVETDPRKYFSTLERVMTDGWSFETARRAFRWGCYEFERTLYFIDDGFLRSENADRHIVRRAIERLGRMIDPDFSKKVDFWRRTRRLKETKRISNLFTSGAFSLVEIEDLKRVDAPSVDQEAGYLHTELKRIAFAMFSSQEARQKSRLFSKLMAGAPAATAAELRPGVYSST